jgi:translation initiation factor IF-2
MVDGEVWGEDAVHPTAAAYREMAVSTVRLAEGALCLPIGGGKRQRPVETSGEPREDGQRGGGWQPLGGGRYLRYEDRDGGGGGGGSREDLNSRRMRQDVEVIGEYGGGGGGQGGGSDGYQGGGGGQRGGQRSRPWNGGRGYGGGGRQPRRV